mmetsp:Transcript_896/g.1763  ORF Transcript_896/g.1763 Transcript_896/m.1763 type:complete len:200 (-) Transcript_896:392-991(-)
MLGEHNSSSFQKFRGSANKVHVDDSLRCTQSLGLREARLSQRVPMKQSSVKSDVFHDEFDWSLRYPAALHDGSNYLGFPIILHPLYVAGLPGVGSVYPGKPHSFCWAMVSIEQTLTQNGMGVWKACSESIRDIFCRKIEFLRIEVSSRLLVRVDPWAFTDINERFEAILTRSAGAKVPVDQHVVVVSNTHPGWSQTNLR